MPDPGVETRTPARPSPAPALERRFQAILQQQMQGVPILNPALQVQAVGFQAWGDHWLGVLVTPWFMNLMLLPRVDERWPAIAERESRHCVFPAGVFEFIGGRDAEIGDYQACSLFSPMFDFNTQADAAATAAAALLALFDAANRPAPELADSAMASEGAVAELAATPPAATAATPVPIAKPAKPAHAATPALSKRDFLFGSTTRADRAPRG